MALQLVVGFGVYPSLSMLGFVWLEPLKGLCILSWLLWIHVWKCPTVPRKHCFLVVIYGPWLLESFCPIFHNDLWTLGNEDACEMSHLGLIIVQFCLRTFTSCRVSMIIIIYWKKKLLWWGYKHALICGYNDNPSKVSLILCHIAEYVLSCGLWTVWPQVLSPNNGAKSGFHCVQWDLNIILKWLGFPIASYHCCPSGANYQASCHCSLQSS